MPTSGVLCRLPAGLEAVKQLLSLAAFGSRSRLYSSCRTEQQQLLAPAFLEVHAQILAALKAWCHWLAALHSESLRSAESLYQRGDFFYVPYSTIFNESTLLHLPSLRFH